MVGAMIPKRLQGLRTAIWQDEAHCIRPAGGPRETRPLARDRRAAVRRPEGGGGARDERAWAFWLEVERAVKELLTAVTPPGTTQH